MGEKPIQERFGQQVIDLFSEFARADEPSVEELIKNEFSHVGDVDLRRALAQVYFGVRWIYKLGLALLVKDEERAAHVRAQLVDYGSVCEGLLSYCIGLAIKRGKTKGTGWQYADPDVMKKPLTWNTKTPEPTLNKQSLWWLVRIAHGFGIVGASTEHDLQWLRDQRNSVHLRQRASIGNTAYLNQSKRAYMTTREVIRATKLWIAAL
jgi:hypothetical protein